MNKSFHFTVICRIALSLLIALSLAGCDNSKNTNQSTQCDNARCTPPKNLVALADVEAVRLSWSAPDGALQPIGYKIHRNGVALVDVNPSVLSYEDTTAPAGLLIVDEVTLNASYETSEEGVELSWSASVASLPGLSMTYAVDAFYLDGTSARAVVEGYRAAPSIPPYLDPPITYELMRGTGGWIDVGEQTEYFDRDAPRASLTGSAAADVDFFRGGVALRTTAVLKRADEAEYWVRAKIGTGSTTTSNMSKGRRASTMSAVTSIHWERETQNQTTHYDYLPGLTGQCWFDPDPALDVESAYQAIFTTQDGDYTTSVASISFPSSMVQISAGLTASNACGIRDNGKVICWGWNAIGQPSSTPPTDSFQSIAIGDEQSCGIKIDGKLSCWGYSYYPPSNLREDIYKAISSGSEHSCALRDDDKVVCWGPNDEGQAPSGASEDSFKAISAGAYHTCGIRTDDKVICWGLNDAGQAPSGASEDSFKVISAGTMHTCGIRTDDKVVCWGWNGHGQAPSGTSEDSFKAISAGAFHTCGIRMDGKTICWGLNYNGQAPREPREEAFKAITAGAFHTCGFEMDGQVICWGSNAYEICRP
ncbi:MAG: hypothetical protein LBM75_01530 [Myxococcales bacterium]|nr:hypothetical protein [Myxococcales bacterium]